MKRINRKDPNWTNDQGVNVGLFIFRIIVGFFLIVFILMLIVGLVVDLWRFWYGAVIVLVAVWASKRFLFFAGPWLAPRALLVLVIILAVSAPYGFVQFQINKGNLQSLNEGIGIWKCKGDYQWFWNAMENCRVETPTPVPPAAPQS